jgi:hypothetical protein
MICTASRGFAVRPSLPKPVSSLESQSIEEFRQKVEREFVEGSAINPALYSNCIEIVPDLEVGFGGEVSTPIHDALGWRYTRFGNQTKPTFYAALFVNEDGSPWQAKLSKPRTDLKKEKLLRYETPVGNGSRAFLPAVDERTRWEIAQHYECEVPSEGSSFWQWVEQHPEIPIVLTEGGKKGLAGLSQGYVVLALYGCNGGYRSKDALGNPIKPYLIPDMERFAVPGRRFVLAFDQDEEEKTRRRVNIAQSRFGSLLMAKGCQVEIARWHQSQGKGLDDLIVQSGAEAWQQAYDEAIPLNQWHILQRLEQRLTYPTNLRVNVGDLSSLDLSLMPQEGLIGVMSAKGTGKTKLIAGLIGESDRVLSITHRIALGRNLCSRLGLTYRGDLDKVGGDYLNEEGYTLRIGTCVDGLLGIDPAKFAGGELILDEVTQVVRHLLTSSTCAREGKRPALLARFRELVRNAKRVICADADLDNATLNYLRELRGDNCPLFLLRNEFKSEAYDCRFISSPDRTAIVGELLDAVELLPVGKVLFVATDSKATSKSVDRLIHQRFPEKRVLVLNSETSGGEFEREFMATPDLVLERGDYDIIVCSPSVATGVSIECRGVVEAVYGIFAGVSSNDGDISQSLSRVRESVQRVVWSAVTGSNYSKVSRALSHLEVKYHLQSATNATVQLIRSSLREDVAAGVSATDWQADPHMGLYCHIAAEQNRSMRSLRDALLTRLQFEGNRVEVVDLASTPAVKTLLGQSRLEIQLEEAEALAAVETLSYADVTLLEQKETLTPEERLAISKYYLLDFYGLNELTVEDVIWDNEGRKRREILNLEALLMPEAAVERTVRGLERQAQWKQGYCLWDVSQSALRSMVRDRIGLTELIQKMRDGWQWCRYDLQPYAEKARQIAQQVKVALHFTIKAEMSDVQIIHQLLSQLGLKFEQRWSRAVEGYEGEKLRVYTLEQQTWGRICATLQRRQQRRMQREAERHGDGSAIAGSPPIFQSLITGGDPDLAQYSDWLTEECVSDLRQWWAATETDAAARAALTQDVPVPVLRHLGLAS